MDNGEDRGVTPILGAVLLAGILVMGMTIWQVQVIPIENENREFQHYQSVGDDMQDVRSAWVNTAGTGSTTSATVQLGFQYPERTILISPPAASGTLQIEEGGEITGAGFNMSKTCGVSHPVNMSYISYTPNYAELSMESYILEYGLLYRNVSGEPILESEQLLVDGETINLYGLQGNQSVSSSERESIDFQGAKVVGINGSQSEQVWLNLSTHSPQAWVDALADVENVNQTLTSTGTVHIQLKQGDYDIRCPISGVGYTPNLDPANIEGVNEINPPQPGDVSLVNASRDKNKNELVHVYWNNTGDNTRNITEARISFYHDASGATGDNAVEYANMSLSGESDVRAQLYIRDEANALDPQINLTRKSPPTNVDLRFYNGKGNKFSVQSSDWFVIYLYFDSGEQGLYFISPSGK